MSASKATRKLRREPAFTMTIPASPGVPGKSFAELTLEALVDAFTRFRDESGLGASDIGGRWPQLQQYL